MYRRTSQHIRASTSPSLTRKTKSVTFDLPLDNDQPDNDYDEILLDTVNSHHHKNDETSQRQVTLAVPAATHNDITKSSVKLSISSPIDPSVTHATTDLLCRSTRSKRASERYGFLLGNNHWHGMILIRSISYSYLLNLNLFSLLFCC